MKKTATISKKIIAEYYGLDAVYSYIMGRSNGAPLATICLARAFAVNPSRSFILLSALRRS